MTTIYKICQRTAWRRPKPAGRYAGSQADRRDGFIHFSTAAQLEGTAVKHFAGLSDLMLVAVDGDALGGRAEMGTLARRWSFSSPLCCRASIVGGVVGAPARRRDRRSACLSGARLVIAAFEHLVRPLLHVLDPEDAHALTLKLLEIRAGAAGVGATTCAARGARLRAEFLPTRSAWRRVSTRMREVPDVLLRLGFGFVEVGHHYAAGRNPVQSAPAPVFGSMPMAA